MNSNPSVYRSDDSRCWHLCRADAVPNKDRIHLGELAELVSLQLTPTWNAVQKVETYKDFKYEGYDAPRTTKSRKFTNGGNAWAVSSGPNFAYE